MELDGTAEGGCGGEKLGGKVAGEGRTPKNSRRRSGALDKTPKDGERRSARAQNR